MLILMRALLFYCLNYHCAIYTIIEQYEMDVFEIFCSRNTEEGK